MQPITPTHVAVKYMQPHGTNRYSWSMTSFQQEGVTYSLLCKVTTIIPTTACHWGLNEADLANTMIKYDKWQLTMQ